MCMRTNIVLDDALVKEAMTLSGETTKTGVIHRALKEFVQRQGLQAMVAHFGTIQWEGDLDVMRERVPAHGTARRHQRHR
jgi:Arc/MetJ family transcription regulator